MLSLDSSKKLLTIETNYLAETNEIQIAISDTGVGIPKDKLDTIFQKVESTKINQGGTGIGMMIIKRIVNAHKGKITVESEVGLGAKFTILIPVN